MEDWFIDSKCPGWLKNIELNTGLMLCSFILQTFDQLSSGHILFKQLIKL
jgi:hypothetical protein